MKKTLFALALLAVTSGTFAKTLVTVNNTPIDSSVIDNQVKLITQKTNGQVKDSEGLRHELLNRVILNTVIADQAKKLKLDQQADYKSVVTQALADAKKKGLDKQPAFKYDFNLLKQNLLVQAYAINVLKKHPISDAEIQKRYNEMKKFYQGSQEVQLAEVIVKTQADADKIIAELKKGKKFSDLAKAYSIDPKGKANGGQNKEYINLKDMQAAVPNLYSAVSNLKVGQYTAPIPLQGAFVIFEVSNKRPAQLPALDKVKDIIKAQLQDQEFHQSIEQLMKSAKITYAK